MNSGLSSRISHVKRYLEPIGYGANQGQLVEDYRFITPTGIHSSSLIAFGHPKIKDISTSCIAVEDCITKPLEDTIFHKLAYIGVPEVTFLHEGHVERWSLSSNNGNSNQPQKIASINYNDLQGYFQDNKRELSPSHLLTTKDYQRSFFDLDRSLIQFAREHTQETLVKRFESAYSNSLALLRSKITNENPHADEKLINKLLNSKLKSFDQMAINVLAVCILKDKLRDDPEFSNLQVDDIWALLTAAGHHFPGYFYDTDTISRELDAWEIVEYQYEELRREFIFDSLTNDVLAYFYENTLVKANPKLQRELGIYYTPRHITDRILERLPIEFLPPDKRIVFDGTCGSGNMLLSAYERLSNLLPGNFTLEQRHQYLINKIWGVDQDANACKVARLSLLKHSLPAGDSWQIKQGNIFDAKPSHGDWFGGVPHIIIGNPPFGSQSIDGHQVETAARVIEKYMDWLPIDGLLGVVMPASFLTATRGNLRQARQRLLRQFDILEVWQLPQGTFASSDVPTIVILAQKLKHERMSGNGYLTRIGHVESYDRQKFKETENPTFEFLASQDDWFNSHKHQMASSNLDPIWRRIESENSSAEPHFCILRKGINPGKKANAEFFSDLKHNENWKPCLRRNQTGNALEPFAINRNNQVFRGARKEQQPSKFMKYEAPYIDIHNPRTPEHFEEKEKLIVNAIRQANNPWRIFAAIDREQVLVIKAFHYVLPKNNIPIEVLVAVFNSMIANAWYASHYYQKDVKLEVLKKLPIPQTPPILVDQIKSLVVEISSLKKRSPRDHKKIRDAIVALDDLIFQAYGLTKEEQERIQAWMNFHHKRPGEEWEGVELRDSSPRQSQTEYPWWQRRWRFVGEVEAVDKDKQTITLVIEGSDEDVIIKIPTNMPGWILREGVVFRASIPWEQRYPADYSQVDWQHFEPMDFGYLTEDEMLDVIEGRKSIIYE